MQMSTQRSRHGTLRGPETSSDLQPESGRFGRFFPELREARFDESALSDLGREMIDNNPAQDSKIPAGYTYFAQFVDHDLSFDPGSNLQQKSDPNALEDYRTPRFDLDSVYGRGPEDQPYLYQEQNKSEAGHERFRFLLGNAVTAYDASTLKAAIHGWDVPRCMFFPDRARMEQNHLSNRNSSERAIIADPRNDANVIISQLHGLFLGFHNYLLDNTETASFEHIQQEVRWHYQWLVLYDFLPRIIELDVYKRILRRVTRVEESGPPRVIHDPQDLAHWRRQICSPTLKTRPFLPIEFSAAAFRFAHSMVGPEYLLNHTGNGGPIAILSAVDDGTDLRGFRAFQNSWLIDWSLFFDQIAPLRGSKHAAQYSRKIVTSLAKPLAELPFPIVTENPSNLAQRDLIRGWRLGLPSGQDVAGALQLEPIKDRDLLVGPARKPITAIWKRFAGRAPLWFYVLAESQHYHDGNRLGPVGSRIVMETCVSLLMHDSSSFPNRKPRWKPSQEDFEIAHFIEQARKYGKNFRRGKAKPATAQD